MIDLSRPRMNLSFNVKKLGATDLGPIRRAVDIVATGHHLFLCSGPDGIHVINVADPKKPHVVGSWGWWQEEWVPYCLKIIGDQAFVVGRSQHGPPELRILDISRPTHPREVGCCTGDGVPSWEPFHWDVEIGDQCAYVVFGGDRIWVVDVSDPSAPEEVCDIVMRTRTTAIQIHGSLAYVVAGGLQVMDVADPLKPAVIGRCETIAPPRRVGPLAVPTEEPTCRQMVIADRRAYVSDENGNFSIIDISRPEKPVKIGTLRTAEDMRHMDLAVHGDFAFVLELGRRGHMAVFDMSDPVSPVATGFRDIPVPCYCVSAAGDHVYIAGFTHFGVYDCTAAMKKA